MWSLWYVTILRLTLVVSAIHIQHQLIHLLLLQDIDVLGKIHGHGEA